MKINYFSDTHLEFGGLAAPDTDADIIVAAGDIGIGTIGVDWLKTLNKPVIYVAGNHEFYGGEYQQTLQWIRKQCANSNVHFLENDSYVFQNVRFLGCTLWTDLLSLDSEKIQILEQTLNDFRRIQFSEQVFTAMQFTYLHHQSRTWLNGQLSQPFSGKTVIVTHHAPSLWSWNDINQPVKKLAYCNDLRSLLHIHDISIWFHGHVHRLTDYRIAGTRILCNPRGYLGLKTVRDFDQNRIVSL